MDPMMLQSILGAAGGGQGRGPGVMMGGPSGGQAGADPMSALAAMRMRLYGMPGQGAPNAGGGASGMPGARGGMGEGGMAMFGQGVPNAGGGASGAPGQGWHMPSVAPGGMHGMANGAPTEPPNMGFDPSGSQIPGIGGMRPLPMPEGLPGGMMPEGIHPATLFPPTTPGAVLKPAWQQLADMGIGGQGSAMANKAKLAEMQAGSDQGRAMGQQAQPPAPAGPGGVSYSAGTDRLGLPAQGPMQGGLAGRQPRPPAMQSGAPTELPQPAQAATQRINSARGYIRDQVRRGMTAK